MPAVADTKIVPYLQSLRDAIVDGFESLEPKARFETKEWKYKKGSGGGEMSVIRGDVFEKAAVNFSCVMGGAFPMDDGKGPFLATGVSLITHMKNPHAPTAHMNVRFIETEKDRWFGGGYDLTPMGFPYSEDTEHFHRIAKKGLDPFGPHLYLEFYEHAKTYFYIPHREKERGVGGIFFDHYNTGDFEKDLGMWKSVGSSLLDAILPIYKRRIDQPYTDSDKETQNKMRAHYVEFNLIYDRGTKFGFQSGGNPEAILCSMPPIATW